MRKVSLALLLVSLSWLSFCPALAADSSNEIITLDVNPPHVRIGTFYHGTKVHITGTVPPCDGVILKIESESKEIMLSRKGKLGIIWMNVARITVENAPEVYLLASSNEVTAICSLEERERLQLGFAALRDRLSFISKGPITGVEFDEFLKLKQHTGTYDDNTSIAMGPIRSGRQAITSDLPLPSVMPSGEYTLKLYCFEAGNPIGTASAKLTIQRTGLPRLAADMALEHAALYGIVAILVAMLAGIMVGVIFSSKGGGGH